MKKLYIFGLMACTLTACKPEIDQEQPISGTANFARYLAVGNSATAGYADNTLYRTGQENSYPAILAGQLALVGGGKFVQPLLPSDVKGYPEARMVLQVVSGQCDTVLRVVNETRGKDSAESSISVAAEGPFNNMGIPGALVGDYLKPNYAQMNPYARRAFQDITASPIKEALRIEPTFFTMWLGNNDVLLTAIYGGELSPIGITPDAQFRAAYEGVLTELSKKAQGVVLNIPDISLLPHFTTITPKGLNLTGEEATKLNVFYRDVVNLPIRFEAGQNYFIIQDGNQVRKIKDDEMLLLSIPYDSLKCGGWGTTRPIPGRFVLNSLETSNIRAAIARFNQIIAEVAASRNVPVVDVNAFLKTIQSGMPFNGITYTSTYINGGFYSLDGVHLTPRGNALLANHIIRTINASFQASVPEVDANKYQGVILPNVQ